MRELKTLEYRIEIIANGQEENQKGAITNRSNTYISFYWDFPVAALVTSVPTVHGTICFHLRLRVSSHTEPLYKTVHFSQYSTDCLITTPNPKLNFI